jgi:hypothetical protein
MLQYCLLLSGPARWSAQCVASCTMTAASPAGSLAVERSAELTQIRSISQPSARAGVTEVTPDAPVIAATATRRRPSASAPGTAPKTSEKNGFTALSSSTAKPETLARWTALSALNSAGRMTIE